MTKLVRSLSSGFLRSATRFSDREALNVAGDRVSYQELAEQAKRLAATLQAGATAGEVPLTAVFAYRSVTAYAAMLGALMAGRGYVPLNGTFPIDRTRLMLENPSAAPSSSTRSLNHNWTDCYRP